MLCFFIKKISSALNVNVQARFNITLDPSSLHFVFLNSRFLVEDSTWPFFTLLGQSIGSMCLAWEAMTELMPDLFIGEFDSASTHLVSRG